MTTLFAGPEMGADTLTARPYQVEATEAVRREFAGGRKSTLVILPTGTGKTVLFSKISRAVVEKGGRVLILAHRGELVDQAVNTLERVGIVAGVERAGSHARAMFDPDVVVGTVQTLQRARLKSWDRDHFRLIIVDEAHHATAETYQNIIKHFRSAKVLGVTATPDRADEDELTTVFESVAYEMSIWDAMTAPAPGPYLSRLRFVQCDVGIDLRGIRTTGGDFNQADLEERIAPLIDTLANAIRQEVGDRQTLTFTPDVGSAMAMASAMQSIGLAADWISGDCPDRAEKIARYKAGDLQVLANCNLLTEGFDAPTTAAIGLCRPTKSRAFYSQMVGRGTRLAPGKADCLLVDFNFLTEKHDLVRPADLFDTTDTDGEVLDIADELLKAKPGSDLMEAIEQARATQQQRQVLRIQARERQVKYRRVSYDPLATAETLGVVMRGNTDARHDPPTDKQIEYALTFGITSPETLSRRRLSRLLDVLSDRRKFGLATPKQVAHLIRNGVAAAEARNMSKREATAALDRLWGKGGG
ncbi:DEAD/DEAH box helicase [Singulisphaera sp. PoT]|uniref:DEAD/DEAH box helicase n=1 Tax=Singulisphaera sp. PoT TaxID=3411797 RepID=UPI003BF5AF1B